MEHTSVRTSHVSGTVPGTEDTTVSDTDHIPGRQSLVPVKEKDFGQTIAKTAEQYGALGEGTTSGSFSFFLFFF